MDTPPCDTSMLDRLYEKAMSAAEAATDTGRKQHYLDLAESCSQSNMALRPPPEPVHEFALGRYPWRSVPLLVSNDE